MKTFSVVVIRYFMILALSASFSSSVQATRNIISLVDNANKLVVINDKPYKISISTQVYIIDSATTKPRKVNRYALRVGQTVFIKSQVRDRQRYIERITIASY